MLKNLYNSSICEKHKSLVTPGLHKILPLEAKTRPYEQIGPFTQVAQHREWPRYSMPGSSERIQSENEETDHIFHMFG